MAHPSGTSTALATSTVLGPDPQRRSHAEAWLGRALKTWGLRPALGGRWLAAADAPLRGTGELTLSAEYDPDLEVVTLEIWENGRRVYGIDDWLG